ncbi:flagellar protein FlgJ [endosymbiont of Acanthamoeba sp. UWC8]|uniref:rod-binding protein n=1 Tax=endosymbiont of Acanthamoeba sp. UWC8 TaxID=86106 RepID=UPI0004D1502D|nr:rod-binding protein [endosymbiont of Acanthamoeba sp. UWC8]AIF81285.1 flagellar protein FlgJ [endosymbiont of Acanthamoeba sp. UWC8]
MTNIHNLTNSFATMQVDQGREKSLSGNSPTKEAAQEFSAYVVSHLLKEASPPVNNHMLNENSTTQEIFEGLLTNEYAKVAAKQDSLGITKIVESSLLQVQEQSLGE